MYGSPGVYRPRGSAGRGRGSGGGGRKPSQQPPAYYAPRNPNYAHPATAPSPSSSFSPAPHHQQQNPSFQTPYSFFAYPVVTREMVEAAVAKVERDLLSAGENVSVWKVTQSAALALQISSWESIGFKFNDIPYLRSLQFVEGKVNSFIHCFVSVRRMTTVHDLGLEICKSEGVEQFEELGLGPLLRHPLVRHYFMIPSELKEVCSITIDDLMSALSTFLYKVKFKEITVEEFLTFLVEKYSLPARENLGVRIQSMGLYIKFLKGARRAEWASLKNIQENGLLKEKQERQTYLMPDHLISLSSLLDEGNEETNKMAGYLDFGNIDVALGNKCCKCCPAQKRKRKKQTSCQCNGSPFLDEFKLIGLKLAMFNYVSSENLPTGQVEKQDNYAAAAYEIVKIDPTKSDKLILTTEQLDRFAATWKGACQKHAADEVLALMLNIYTSSDKNRRKMQRLFLQYPAVGILNLAVRALKGENLDIVVRASDEHASVTQSSSPCVEIIKSESSSENDSMSDNEKFLENSEKIVSVEDIAKQIDRYFKLDCLAGRKDLPLEKQLVLQDCRIWLKNQFLVDEFESLGHGRFYDFLDKYISVLPGEIKYFLAGNFCNKPSFEVSMSQRQISVVVSQAARNCSENTKINEKRISMLLRKQFPAITLHIAESVPDQSFLDLLNIYDVSCSVAFSMSLLGNKHGRNSHTELPDMILGGGELSCSNSSNSMDDAIACLLRAPMLSDMRLWSHWDLVYGPALGPLNEWLIDLGSVEGLLCIVTTDGKIIRVDNSASLDGFLEALIHRSAFHVALKLLSLFHVYGGSQNIPISLLRCYAQQGIDAIIKSYMDDFYNNSCEIISESKSSLDEENVPCCSNDCKTFESSLSTFTEIKERRIINKDVSLLFKAYSSVSLFILDCLQYHPSEFWTFTADILVSAFQFFNRDAPMLILNRCKGVNERIMLHEIGLALGIVEWIEDYRKYCSTTCMGAFESSVDKGKMSTERYKNLPGISRELSPAEHEFQEVHEAHSETLDSLPQSLCCVDNSVLYTEESGDEYRLCYDSNKTGSRKMQEVDAAFCIEKIRKEEFGLDSDLSNEENILLKKQHARLGRALHCLSQELYSQDSHFILELVQNADDNSYHGAVEPTLVFILHASGVVVMNNELGFSTENIRALCDVGNSTKKGSSGGYIGQKGIGFKSVFRITNAPEIHSNGFHVKFDITEGQIGFVLPTVIPRCDINFFKKQLLHDSDNDDSTSWNTCIVLPFKSKLKQGKDMSSVISMFSDLHPSLLLFLQRLKCIMFKNMLDGNCVIMRRETLTDGVVMVSHGPEKLGWLVVRKDLQASFIRPDVQTTKIALAFTIEQSEKGDYKPVLDQQPVFAFLPLRKYGLKFIIQADFVLPSSREEVDEDSAWNQWLLSELPDLFVSSEKSFCALACFKDNPAKGITSFMSFVPLTGEVHGFFSSLPHMILSKLRLSNCLLSEGSLMEWVPPCKVLRSWSEPLRIFLTDNLLQHHLGLHYLNKDISLPDSLARALGVQEYGPKILIGLLSSICQGNGIEELGLDWLSSWLHAFYTTLPVSPPGCLTSENTHIGSDLVNSLRKISFIPLSDGSFCSLEKGPIWLPYDISDKDSEGQSVLKNLPGLYAELRTVSCSLFSVKTVLVNSFEEDRVDILIKALQKIGLQKLSAHDIVRNHILPSISVVKTTNRGKELMVEYLLFIMIHLQTSCIKCNTEREDILSQVRKKAILLTNNGYICPIKEPIHFSKELGNTLNIKDIVNDINIKWNEVDSIYLKHPSTQTLSFGLMEWREFFKELGVTDFVQVNPVKKNVVDNACSGFNAGEVLVDDWDSPELISILSAVSSNKCLEKSRYLLKVLDELWDDFFSAKAKCCSPFPYEMQRKLLQSSFMKCMGHFKWVACSIDEELHYPEDLFYDSESVHSLLGTIAPYAVPQVTSRTFVEDIGFKVSVTLDDALRILQIWRCSPYHSASISQMSKFYTFIRDELVKMTGRVIPDVSKDIVIFVPLANTLNHMDIISGVFMQPDQLYWHDPTGGAARISKAGHMCDLLTERLPCINLDSIYPELYGFFVADCGVLETPSVGCYFHILLHLSRLALPSEVAHEVFNIFLKWSGDVMSGIVQDKDILELKENLLKSKNAVLPTAQNKWVSLHSSFGLICWCEDQKLIDEYIDIDNVNIIYFGKLTMHEKEMHSGKVAGLLKSMGIPILEEVVCREAIFYGVADATNATSLINWVIPYAQRYLYKLHSNTYCNFKESEHKLTQLEVFVVEKLFYRNTLQGNYSMSKKRYECKSLLQGNSLYTTPHADTHSIFLEFSRIFFNGTPDLLMANFLHIVSNEFSNLGEQIESFIVNNLNVPELPEGEPIWSVLRSHELCEKISSTSCPSMIVRCQNSMPSRKQYEKLSWPPTKDSTPRLQPVIDRPVVKVAEAKADIIAPAETEPTFNQADQSFPTSLKESTEEKQPATSPSCANEGSSSNAIHGIIDLIPVTQFTERDRLLLEAPEEEQSYRTGRLGEMVAYKYFCEKLGQASVKWVNEKSEMRLPYDLIVNEEQNSCFVEVKATTSASKDWFLISTNEWNYACKKRGRYSIVWVTLSSSSDAEVIVFNDPLKLCQQNLLQLALLMPKNAVIGD